MRREEPVGKQWVTLGIQPQRYFIVWSLQDGIIPLPEDGKPPKPVSKKSAKSKAG